MGSTSLRALEPLPLLVLPVLLGGADLEVAVPMNRGGGLLGGCGDVGQFNTHKTKTKKTTILD